MYKILKKFYSSFKEYIILIFLLLVSLSILPLNKKANVKTLRTYALGNMALVNSVISKFKNLYSLSRQVKQLEQKNAELMIQVNQLREYGLVNSELKNLLKLKDSTNFPLIPSTIVTKFIPGREGYLIINVGSKDNVNIGMPVVNESGFVGIVTDTTGEFSVVKTLKSPDSKLAVRDQRSGVDGILSWNGNEFIIQNVPTTDDVNIGDRIVTSPVSTISPPSLPIGVVNSKKTSIAGLLTDVSIVPFVDFVKLRNVAVLKIISNSEIDHIEEKLLKEVN